jgi:ABC-type transport system involved in multi-copper enzyme maturation permease subunit
MSTVILYTLRESIHRRMGLALIVFAVIVPALLLGMTHVTTGPDGKPSVKVGSFMEATAEIMTQSIAASLLDIASAWWLIIGLFAVAPLLTSYQEKGWADLLLSKGIARWQMVVGRYLGAIALFGITLVFMAGAPMLYLWARTGVSTRYFFGAVGLLLLAFASLLSLMALASMAMPNPAVPILFAFLYSMLSPVLLRREGMLYDVFKWKAVQWLLDWAYRILPKQSELVGMARVYLGHGKVDSWWPVWSSALFIVGALVLSSWLLHRKDF